MLSVGGNRERFSLPSVRANWNTAPPTLDFSNELHKTTSNLLTAMENNDIKYREAGELKVYLGTLSRKERARFIKWVAEECRIARPVFYSWCYMCSRIPDFAKRIIEKCADQQIFDLDKTTIHKPEILRGDDTTKT